MCLSAIKAARPATTARKYGNGHTTGQHPFSESFRYWSSTERQCHLRKPLISGWNDREKTGVSAEVSKLSEPVGSAVGARTWWSSRRLPRPPHGFATPAVHANR